MSRLLMVLSASAGLLPLAACGNNAPTRASTAASSPPPATTYRVLKASVPGDPSTAQQVCGPITYPGYDGNVATPLQSGATPAGAPAPFATYFRQWVSLCSVSGNAGDEYFIQVSTDNGSGSNHFSLRGAAILNSAAQIGGCVLQLGPGESSCFARARSRP